MKDVLLHDKVIRSGDFDLIIFFNFFFMLGAGRGLENSILLNIKRKIVAVWLPSDLQYGSPIFEE